jgi:RNA polymerase sigma factor (sigma-70 family)
MKVGATDNIYIQRVLRGDKNAYAMLVNKYKQMVFSVSMRILRNREDAEESAQDSFLKAYAQLAQFNGKASFSTWLYRIAYTTAISMLRKRKTEVKSESIDEEFPEDDMPEAVNDALNMLEAEDQRRYIDKALDRLSNEDSLLITMYYLEGFSVAEIAVITELSMPNIKVILFRSRKKLFSILNKLMKDEINMPV